MLATSSTCSRTACENTMSIASQQAATTPSTERYMKSGCHHYFGLVPMPFEFLSVVPCREISRAASQSISPRENDSDRAADKCWGIPMCRGCPRVGRKELLPGNHGFVQGFRSGVSTRHVAKQKQTNLIQNNVYNQNRTKYDMRSKPSMKHINKPCAMKHGHN